MVALWVVALSPVRAGEPELAPWLESLRAPPARDDEALVVWRGREPFLGRRLAKVLADEGRTLRARGGALFVLAVVGQSSDIPAKLPAALDSAATRARARVRQREVVLSLLRRTGSASQIQAALPEGGAYELLELVSDPLWTAPPARRLRAVRCVGLLSGALATAALWARLSDGDRDVQLAATDGLAARGALRALERGLPTLLSAGHVRATAAALRHLEEGEGRRPLQLCRGLLRSQSRRDEAKATLARALGDLKWTGLAGALQRLARDERQGPYARCAARAALCALGEATPARVNALVLTALSDEATLSGVALEGLAHAPRAALTSALAGVLRQADPRGVRRARAIQACEALRVTGLRDELIHVLGDGGQPPSARLAAAHALAEVGGREGERALVSAASYEEAGLRRAAVAGLGRRARLESSVSVRVALETALGDKETTVRRAALRALSALRDERSRRALSRPLPEIRRLSEAQAWLQAAHTLGVREPEAARRLLALWRRSGLRSDPSLASATLRYAGELPAVLAAPALLELLSHPDPQVTRHTRAQLVARYPAGQSFPSPRTPAGRAAWSAAWAKHAKDFH
jgi:hypothetical protein